MALVPHPHISEDDYLHCIRCGQCLAVCPTYRLTLNETDSPRARVALLRAVREGLLERPTDRTAAQFFRCLLCGACTFTCPSGVTVDRVLELTRGEMAELGLLPQPLVALNQRIRESHNISAEPPESRLLWAQNLPAPPTGLGKAQAEVVYFVGCVGALFPRSYGIPQSFVQILEGAGVDYALLGAEEWCCGYPLAINGDLEGAREMMRHNLEAVRATGARTLVTTCPSCFHFWKHAYPAALEEDLGLEVRHATEFLADLLEAGRVPLRDDLPEQVVTYHDPCDLGRKSGVFDAPRRILRAIPGVTLVEMAENQGGSHCCGGGGNLESMDPALSQGIAARRIRQAAETGAQVVVSACQQCERTLFNAARAERLRLRVKDIAEIVLEAMRR
ncbi:MAG: (Fe-S)-binding protein [Thermoflexales bacterium]|nr:(Fe-S)-binding protein [Thermoflexales bacterium]